MINWTMKHKQNCNNNSRGYCMNRSNTYGSHHNYNCFHLRNLLYKWSCKKSCMNLGMWPSRMHDMPWSNCCNFQLKYSYKCCYNRSYILPCNWSRSFHCKYWHIPYRNFRYNFQSIRCSIHFYKCRCSCCRSLLCKLLNKCQCNLYKLRSNCRRMFHYM